MAAGKRLRAMAFVAGDRVEITALNTRRPLVGRIRFTTLEASL